MIDLILISIDILSSLSRRYKCHKTLLAFQPSLWVFEALHWHSHCGCTGKYEKQPPWGSQYETEERDHNTRFLIKMMSYALKALAGSIGIFSYSLGWQLVNKPDGGGGSEWWG